VLDLDGQEILKISTSQVPDLLIESKPEEKVSPLRRLLLDIKNVVKDVVAL
jgi:hypothetical protein